MKRIAFLIVVAAVTAQVSFGSGQMDTREAFELSGIWSCTQLTDEETDFDSIMIDFDEDEMTIILVNATVDMIASGSVVFILKGTWKYNADLGEIRAVISNAREPETVYRLSWINPYVFAIDGDNMTEATVCVPPLIL